MRNPYPWMKFYPADFLNDPNLKLCPLGAVGLWIKMLCVMHECIPYGHLTIDGRAMTMDELAKIISEKKSKVIRFGSILESKRIYSVTENGIIFSRKMVRDFELSSKRINAGTKGGNPILVNQMVKQEVNQEVNHLVNPRVRSQIKDKNTDQRSFEKYVNDLEDLDAKKHEEINSSKHKDESQIILQNAEEAGLKLLEEIKANVAKFRSENPT